MFNREIFLVVIFSAWMADTTFPSSLVLFYVQEVLRSYYRNRDYLDRQYSILWWQRLLCLSITILSYACLRSSELQKSVVSAVWSPTMEKLTDYVTIKTRIHAVFTWIKRAVIRGVCWGGDQWRHVFVPEKKIIVSNIEAAQTRGGEDQ